MAYKAIKMKKLINLRNIGLPLLIICLLTATTYLDRRPAYNILYASPSGADQTTYVTSAFADSANWTVQLTAGTFNVDCGAGEINIPDFGVVIGPGAYNPDETGANNPNYA